jgi:hypothetical protein
MPKYIVMAPGQVRQYESPTPAAALKSFIRFIQRYTKQLPELILIKQDDNIYKATVSFTKKFRMQKEGSLYKGYEVYFTATIGFPIEVQPLKPTPGGMGGRKTELYDYAVLPDGTITDLWKYEYDPDAAGLTGVDWRWPTVEEWMKAVLDCVQNKCFVSDPEVIY